MTITFGSNKLQKTLKSSSEILRRYGQMAKRIQQRLDEMESSPNLKTLMQIPAANCHGLSGSRKGEWAVNISANHRMIFELDHDPVPRKDCGEVDTVMVTDIRIIETSDYH